jgi:2'-5' RNA ligase
MSNGLSPVQATQRLFVALSMPGPAVEQLVDTQRAVAEMARQYDIRIRLTRREQFHVTLAFLGDVPSSRVQSILDALREVTAGHVGCLMIARGLIAFPSEKKARVIAVSFEDLSGTLATLVPSLHSHLRQCGCTLENRAFHAHVTLARLPSAHRIELDSMGADLPKEPANCREIHVFHSILNSKGSEYHSLGRTESKDSQ